jgi:hypothetical protein
MNHGSVPQGNVGANVQACFFERPVQNGSILDVHPVANADFMHIGTNNRLEPKSTVGPRFNVAHNGGIGSNPIVGTKMRHKASNRQDQWAIHTIKSF